MDDIIKRVKVLRSNNELRIIYYNRRSEEISRLCKIYNINQWAKNRKMEWNDHTIGKTKSMMN